MHAHSLRKSRCMCTRAFPVRISVLACSRVRVSARALAGSCEFMLCCHAGVSCLESVFKLPLPVPATAKKQPPSGWRKRPQADGMKTDNDREKGSTRSTQATN